METPIIKKRKTASQLLKEYSLSVEEAEIIFSEVLAECEKEEKDEDAKNANEMEALDISEYISSHLLTTIY